ncbi:hypothetical protein TrCOL_g9942 [Triparma columacea]|uniref:Uncharacterized protein n=1 Tax=Triparma columacea TaxID=722753 RepID=A0A9W7FWX3_9STRA|nr:hypothetical protein TrCOL_g9942 [Triparma columacea]
MLLREALGHGRGGGKTRVTDRAMDNLYRSPMGDVGGEFRRLVDACGPHLDRLVKSEKSMLALQASSPSVPGPSNSVDVQLLKDHFSNAVNYSTCLASTTCGGGRGRYNRWSKCVERAREGNRNGVQRECREEKLEVETCGGEFTSRAFRYMEGDSVV